MMIYKRQFVGNYTRYVRVCMYVVCMCDVRVHDEDSTASHAHIFGTLSSPPMMWFAYIMVFNRKFSFGMSGGSIIAHDCTGIMYLSNKK